MSDKRPTTADELEKYAREKLTDLCEDYRKEHVGMGALALTIDDWNDPEKEDDKPDPPPGMKAWWDKLNVEQKAYKNIDNEDTVLITNWLSKSEYEKEIRVKGTPQILLDYMKSKVTFAEEQTKTAKNNWIHAMREACSKDETEKMVGDGLKGLKKTYEDTAKNLKGFKEDHEAMEQNGIGGYSFYSPILCNPNLFSKRKFVGNELEIRSENQIRVMHWNILADALSGSGISLNQYKKSLEKQFASPKECLIWDYRKWLILEEIAHFNPDIITLVELDKGQDCYGRDVGNEPTKKGCTDPQMLQYWLEKIGYDMEYRSKGKGFALHGTGIFWKRKKLDLVPKYSKQSNSELISEQFANQTGKQIFSLMRFTSVQKKEVKLAVCAVHLQSDKEQKGEFNRAMQIWQAIYWLNYPRYNRELKRVWTEMNVNKKPLRQPFYDLTERHNIMEEYPVILTGDFNAERKMGIDEKGSVYMPLAVSVPERAGFKSFYDEVNNGDLPWTSWKKRPAGRTDKYAIDYIFGSKGKTKGLAVLGEVPDDMVDENILLPNYESGSDHISLVVDFEIGEFTEAMTPGKIPKGETVVNTKGWNSSTIWIIGVAVAVALVVFTMLCWMFAGPGKQSKDDSSSKSQE